MEKLAGKAFKKVIIVGQPKKRHNVATEILRRVIEVLAGTRFVGIQLVKFQRSSVAMDGMCKIVVMIVFDDINMAEEVFITHRPTHLVTQWYLTGDLNQLSFPAEAVSS